MSKKTAIITTILLVFVIASVVYVFVKKDEVKPADSPAQNEKVEEQPATVQAANGKYVDYTADQLAATKGTKLLFFYASWCPQCRALETSIKNTHLPRDVTIFKVDYDSSQSLRAKYGVTLQTTVVKVDDNGEKIASYVAYDEPNFEAVQKALLP